MRRTDNCLHRTSRLAPTLAPSLVQCSLHWRNHTIRFSFGRKPSHPQVPSPPQPERAPSSIVSPSSLSSIRLSRNQLLFLDFVPQVSAGIPNSLVRLHISSFIRGPYSNRIPARRFWRPWRLPTPERIGAMILAELGCLPVAPPVLGNFHLAHLPISAEGHPAQRHAQSRRNFRTPIRRDQKRPYRHSLDRNGFHFAGFHVLGRGSASRCVRDAIRRFHPEIIVGRFQHADPRKGLGPVRGEVAGNHYPYRKAVQHRQWLAVHQIRHYRFIQRCIR